MPAVHDAPTAADQERLHGDAGLIPPTYRNRGYEKLDFEAGEGGLGNLNTAKSSGSSDATMDAFLAGVAAGADPKDMAKELRAGSAAAPKRGRGAAKKVAPVPVAEIEEV